MNVQYAIQRDTVFVLEVNPRASRTVPFVSKATGVPLAKVAARFDDREEIARHELTILWHNDIAEIAVHEFYSVKSPVFPFNKFRGVDTILGPEMRSTGEVMEFRHRTDWRLRKRNSRRAAPAAQGHGFLSVNDRDKKASWHSWERTLFARFSFACYARHCRIAGIRGIEAESCSK